MDKFISFKDGLKMPTIGMTCNEINFYFLGLIDEAIELGVRHFEVPCTNKMVFPRMWDRIEYGYDCIMATSKGPNYHEQSNETRDYKNIFFISTTVQIKTRLGPKLDFILTPFLEKISLATVDVLYLENPFNRGANIRKYYEVDPEEPHLGFESLEELFARNPEDGKLMVEPIIQQNLWLMWKRMEKMVVGEKPKARHLGLRYFRLEHIQELLKVVKIPPSVVQVEVNLYNMQTELRRVCAENNILVVAVDPFANFCRRGKLKRLPLQEHPMVLLMSLEVDAEPRDVLLRHLLQSGIPVLYDISHYCYPSVFQNVWSFSLSEDQMRRLGTLEMYHLQQSKTKLDIWCEKDSLWPFRVPRRKKMKRKKCKDVSRPRTTTKKPRKKKDPAERRNAVTRREAINEDCANSPVSTVGQKSLEEFRLMREPLSHLVRTRVQQLPEFGPYLVKERRLVKEKPTSRTNTNTTTSITPFLNTSLDKMTLLANLEGMADHVVDFRVLESGNFSATSKDCFSEAFSRLVSKMLAKRRGDHQGRRGQSDLQEYTSLLGLDNTRPYMGILNMNLAN